MDKTVVDALRRAASLTRAGQPFEATRAIRSALLGKAASPPPAPATRSDARSIGTPTILDLTAERSDRTPPPAAGGWSTRTDAPDTWGLRNARRFARPLAETVRDLAAARRTFNAPSPQRAGPPAIPEGARYLTRTFESPYGSRAYRLYVPQAATSRATGLVMMLHGCKQDPDDFATGTGMNAKADATGMIVLYPAQQTAANPSLCWNWFSAQNQRRGVGEPALLATMAQSVAEEFNVPGGSIFVAGLSAGGAMAAILAETYPDVFSAAGIHSGLPAGAASDVPSAFAAMAGRADAAGSARPSTTDTRLIVFHGTADTVVRATNGEAIVASARRGAAEVRRHDGQTDAGRRYERIVYRTSEGHTLAEHWILRGHGHAWSGGQPEGSYTDQDGPDASAEMMRFFMGDAATRSR